MVKISRYQENLRRTRSGTSRRRELERMTIERRRLEGGEASGKEENRDGMLQRQRNKSKAEVVTGALTDGSMIAREK